MVIAAGSVMKEPRSGPIVRIDNHHITGLPRPSAAIRATAFSARRRIGKELAIDIMTTTNIASAILT